MRCGSIQPRVCLSFVHQLVELAEITPRFRIFAFDSGDFDKIILNINSFFKPLQLILIAFC
jgi:hypothetical protein